MGADDSGENCSVMKCEGGEMQTELSVTTNCFLVLSHIANLSLSPDVAMSKMGKPPNQSDIYFCRIIMKNLQEIL